MRKTLCLITLALCCHGAVSASPSSSSPASEITPAKNSDSSVIKPFLAKYTFYYHGDALGTGTRQLQRLDDGSWRYSYHSKAKFLVFSDERDESSIVTFKDGLVQPQHYRYERTGTGRDKLQEWQYQREQNLATDLQKGQKVKVDFSEPLQDSLSYHLQQRINLVQHPEQRQFVYRVLGSNGKVSTKVYLYDGEEQLNLPYGTVHTVRYKREVIEKRRVTYAWFAPELDYLLVKLNQYKKDSQQFEIQLNSVEFSGEQKKDETKQP